MSSSSSKTSHGTYHYDLNKSQLTGLYNSEVTKVEHVQRPLDGNLGKLGIQHTGVVATTSDGGRWLMHKGKGFGKSSSTIVEKASNMSGKWKVKKSKTTSGHTVSDYMNAGHVDKRYGIRPGSKICWSAARNMMKKGEKKKTIARESKRRL